MVDLHVTAIFHGPPNDTRGAKEREVRECERVKGIGFFAGIIVFNDLRIFFC